MDFKKLECFIALYEEKNFSRAADNMFMAQSSFSSQIKALEEELGVVLVNRDNKRDVHFTKEGSSFYEYAVATLNGYKNIRNQLRNSSSNSIKTSDYSIVPDWIIGQEKFHITTRKSLLTVSAFFFLMDVKK